MKIQVPFRLGASLTSLDPKIMAALFDDGSTLGAPAEVAKLQSRRRCMRHEAQAVQIELERNLAAGASRATILAGLAAEENAASEAASPQCRDGTAYPVQVAEAELRNDRLDGAVAAPGQIMPYVLRALGRIEAWARPLH